MTRSKLELVNEKLEELKYASLKPLTYESIIDNGNLVFAGHKHDGITAKEAEAGAIL